jgi:hypothetical protein
MALALRFEDLVRTGQVKNYTELARLGRVTTTLISQIMSLALLARTSRKAFSFCRPSTAAAPCSC